MTKFLATFLLVSVLSSCVSPQMIPSDATVREMRKVQVLALEPPPLEIPQQVTLQTAQMGGGAGAVAGILFFIEAGSLVHSAAAPETVVKSKTIEDLLLSNDLWIPTSILADEATRQIAATGRSVVRVPGVQPIPGVVSRDYTLLNENWLRPIREWYNSDISSFNYVSLGADKADAVLEVELLNYSVAIEKRLLVQVMVKLIDPSTGKILGRARNWENSSVESIEEALSDNGKEFKQLFAQIGNRLIHKCLHDLGMIPNE